MDYQKFMEKRNAQNQFCKRLGISVVEMRPGYARAVKTVEPEDLNPLNVPHGGVYFSMADTACGFAMATHGHVAVTLDSTYHFLRSARVGDRLTAEATEVKSGRTICIYNIRITNQEGSLLGTGTFTFFQMEEEIRF